MLYYSKYNQRKKLSKSDIFIPEIIQRKKQVYQGPLEFLWTFVQNIELSAL